jgi:alpha-1,6-mannosyltransferase
MACGTPVAVSASSALPEVVGSAGAVAADTGGGFADAVEALLERPERERREAARARAECFGWGAAVEAFLAAHDTATRVRPAGPPPVVPADATARVPGTDSSDELAKARGTESSDGMAQARGVDLPDATARARPAGPSGAGGAEAANGSGLREGVG